MKAIVQHQYGPPNVLKLEDIAKPGPKPDEVLVRVHAAGVDPAAWHFMTGLPYAGRVVFGLHKPNVAVRGVDFAGTVEATGADVTRFQPGDEVFGQCNGAYAEYATARERRIATKPANLTFEQAAAVPESGSTALKGLRDAGQVQPAQKVLIIGAAGGIGHFAVQIAKALGTEVTGVCSTNKTDFVRSLGADHVIDYTRDDFTTANPRYDVILVTAGQRPLSHLRRALTPEGTLVIIGGEGGGNFLGGTSRQLVAVITSRFIRQNLRCPIYMEHPAADLQAQKDLIEASRVTPVIDRTYPLSEAPEAIRHWAEGHARGKIVVTI